MRLSGLVGTFRRLILTAAALASGAVAVGCCGGYQPGGVWDVAIADDGRAVADHPPSVSSDGGLTWSDARSGEYSPTADWVRNAQSVETPRGTFFISGAKVYRDEGGTAREVYSAAHLSQSANRWALALDLSSCEDALTTRPLDIAYHPAGGNVIVAMGQLGVAVGMPGGEWREVAVGDNYPRDFSFAGKMRLLTETGVWVGALAAAFAVGGVAVAFYALSGEGAGRAALIGIGYVAAMPISAAIAWWSHWAGLFYSARTWVFAIIAVGCALFIIARRRKETPPRSLAAAFRALREKVSAGLIIAAGSTAAVLAIAWIALWAYGLYYIILQTIVVAFGLPLFAITRMKASPLRRGIALGCSALGAILGAAALFPYSVRSPGGGADESFTWVLGASAVVFSAVGLALAALAVRRLAAAASAIALSYALLVAAFALWIANAIPAAVLFLLAPIAVVVALRRFLRLDSQRRRGGIAADS